jgi:chloramphenicol-sensitive protein RarD
VSTERRGTALGVAAYLFWGLFPLYWPLLEPAGAVEILAHRVVWSLVFVVALLVVARRTAGPLPRDRRRLSLLALAGVVIGVNWGVFIWAVNNEHVLEGSLGYFINPLVTVALGVLVLGERLRATQWVAVAIATAGVVVLAVETHRPPWIALALALSFGVYGLVKKVVGVGPVAGLTVETAVLTPVALTYLVVLGTSGEASFTDHGADHALLLASTGAVTALPLLAFAAAAAAVPLSRLGLLFYLNPTLQFLIGAFVRHEPISPARLVGFALVWLALAVFTVDSATRRRRDLALPVEAVA